MFALHTKVKVAQIKIFSSIYTNIDFFEIALNSKKIIYRKNNILSQVLWTYFASCNESTLNYNIVLYIILFYDKQYNYNICYIDIKIIMSGLENYISNARNIDFR